MSSVFSRCGDAFFRCLMMYVGLVCGAYLLCTSMSRAEPTFKKDPICDGHETKVVCGTVDVPENQITDSGPTITLDVYVLPAEGDDPAPDPIVYLQGGPGSQSSGNFWSFVQMTELRKTRAIVIVDQRSTSTEKWLCPQYELDEALIIGADIDADESNFRTAGVVKDCFEEMREKGLDPASYTNHANAQDFKDVRIALGYDQWNLWGTSYGTALAQELLKIDGNAVRSAVMDSVVPLDVGWAEGIDDHHRLAFDALNKECQADSACHKRFGDLFELRSKAIETLREQPIIFDEGLGYFDFVEDEVYDTTFIGADRDLFLNDHDLTSYLISYLYTDYYSPVMPLLMDRIVQRDQLFLEKIIGDLAGGKRDSDVGVFFAVACRFPMPSADEASTEVARNREWHKGMSQVDYMVDICAELDLPPVAPADWELPTSEKPVLIIAGDRDPVTPMQFAKHVAANLPNSQIAIFTGKSHGPGYSHCGWTLLADFFDRPHKTKVRNCEKTGVQLSFLTDIIGTAESIGFAETPKKGFGQFAKLYTSLILAGVISTLGTVTMILSLRHGAGNGTGSYSRTLSRISLIVGTGTAVAMTGWFYLSALETIDRFDLASDFELGVVPLVGPSMVWGVVVSLGAILTAIMTTWVARYRQELGVNDLGYHWVLIGCATWLCAFLIYFGIHPALGWEAWRWVATSLNLKFFFY